MENATREVVLRVPAPLPEDPDYAALELLSQALGRTGTHYNFLPQRPQIPIDVDGQTGSGLLVGPTPCGSAQQSRAPPRRRRDRPSPKWEQASGAEAQRDL